MYQNISNTAYITGQNGIYSGKCANPSVAYTKNAHNNYLSYIADFKFEPVQMPDLSNLAALPQDKFEAKMKELDKSIEQIKSQKMPPVDFSCTYAQSPAEARSAAVVLAYEEMGKKVALKTEELTQMLQNTADNLLGKDKVEMSAQALDLNFDGQIDITEYASSILVADALSADKNIVDSRNINGIFNNKGEDALFGYGVKSNYELASATFKGIYQMYGLDKAGNEFLSNPSNLI